MAETKGILTKTVSILGLSGDVVDVKSGYARNYLFPQGLAFAWTKGAEAQIVAMKRARLAEAVHFADDPPRSFRRPRVVRITLLHTTTAGAGHC